MIIFFQSRQGSDILPTHFSGGVVKNLFVLKEVCMVKIYFML